MPGNIDVSQTRRQFLQTASAGTAGLALSPWIASGGPVENRPNIVVILADDMGFSDVGSYNDVNDVHVSCGTVIADAGCSLPSIFSWTERILAAR